MMILLYHWPFATFSISHGWEFMQVFFVLSGYLITLVLIEEKNKYTFKKFAGRFYAKRSLRLFPLYFAYLLGALVLYLLTSYTNITNAPMAQDVAKHGLYLFTYTYNLMPVINFWLGIDYSSGGFSTHLWTLSMEEQFYLVFPFLVFYFSISQMKRMVIAAIFAAFLFRILSYLWYIKVNPEDEIWIVRNLVRIPFAQMDSFAFGAVVALFPLNFIKNAKKWFWLTTAFVISVYLVNMGYVYYIQGETYYSLTYGKRVAEFWMAHNYLFAYIITLVNLWCAILIVYLVRTQKRIPLFENKPTVFFGRLSYGVYLLHLPLLFIFMILLKKLKVAELVINFWWAEFLALVVFLMVTIIICYLINKYFESYFIRLKNKIFKKKTVPGIESPFPINVFRQHQNTAIIDRYKSLNYSDLDRKVNELASFYKAKNIIQQRITYQPKNTVESIANILALLQLNNELIIQDVNSTTTEDEQLWKTHEVNYHISNKDEILDAQIKNAKNHSITESKIFYLSSGSTGNPKVFGYTLDKFFDQLKNWSNHIGQTKEEVVYCPLSISHFHGTIITFSAIFLGSKIILGNEETFDVSEVKKVMDLHRPNIMTGVPYFYQKLLPELDGNFKGFENIRLAICGSAPMSESLSQQYYNRFNIYLNQGYGLSEIGAIAIDLNPALGLGTVGKVLDNIEYKILPTEPIDIEEKRGELIVKARFMVDGYLNQPEQTADMFKDGWLYTKDIVSEDSLGRITILGRASNFVNRAGKKVYPEEVEKLLQSAFPTLQIAVRRLDNNNEEKMIVYVEEDAQANLSEIQSFVERSLAKFKWPNEYKTVEIIPLNQIGKTVYSKIKHT
jgi:long-chain acyl-CoA synthetase